MSGIRYVIVFLEGLVSFLSPCVLPILPVYLAVLSTSNGEALTTPQLKRRLLMRNTLLFVLGIATTFFILGMGIGALRSLLTTYKRYILMVGGVFIMVMGLFYSGDLAIPFLQYEKRFHYQVKEMKAWVAYLLGLTFSFGWTPCIGPMLASVLVVASTSESAVVGNLLIGLYTIGFVIPFLIVAAFSEKLMGLLDKIKIKQKLIKNLGGWLLIIMGIIVFINGVKTPKFVKPISVVQEQVTPEEDVTGTADEAVAEADEVVEVVYAPDFTLVDQYGQTHTLSDYRGKTVFLNFWGTWCPPCRAEMPDIQAVYEDYGYNEEDVVILGVAFPHIGNEGSIEVISSFLAENDYTFPVVMDEEGILMYYYGIAAFPTTFLIKADGSVEGYMQGSTTKDNMVYVIEKTRN